MKFSLVKHIAEIRYPINLRYFDYRNRVFDYYVKDYEDVVVNQNFIELSSKTKMRKIIADSKRFGCTTENIKNPEEYIKNTIKLVKHLKKEFHIENTIRNGSRFFYILDFEKDFETLNNIMLKKFANIGFLDSKANVNDFGHFSFRFTLEGFNYTFRYGPMARKQLEAFVDFKDLQEVPDAFLFLDIDIYLENENNIDISDFYIKTYNLSMDYVNKLKNIWDGD